MPQPRRNDPCPCGSGKKYKQCCLPAHEASAHEEKMQHQAALTSLPSLISEGIGAYRQGQLETARQLFQQVLDISPSDPDALHLMGVICRDTGASEQAIQLINRAIDVLPGEAMFHNSIGIAWRRLGKDEEAHKAYQTALRLKPDYFEAFNNLGNILSEQGELELARDCFEKARRIRPDFAEASFNLGHALQELEDYEAAAEAYEAALAARPDYVDALSNLGMTLHFLDRDDEAFTCFERAVALDSQHQAAYLNIGCILLDRAQAREALPFLEQAYKLAPDNANTNNELARACKNLDSPAETEFSVRAIELAPNSAAADASRVRLAIRCYLNGQDTEAGNWLANAAKPGFSQQRNIVAYRTYLSKLLDWHAAHPSQASESSAPPLQIIGDSHVLTLRSQPAGEQAVTTQVHWIEGCKQWHLGRAESNDYQQQVERCVSTLPAGYSLLFSVGEIDCRLEEGILKAWRKHPETPLDEVMAQTQDAYLDYLSRLRAEHGHEISVCGVPAINRQAVKSWSPERDELASLICRFNRRLSTLAQQRGFGFLDLFALTHAQDGYSNGQWHLDDVHLTPAAYREALHAYWISPKKR